tara:strand:+ start:248 stop:850 length:603 start_codon:yes stop_codon:yes gene_type:complete
VNTPVINKIYLTIYKMEEPENPIEPNEKPKETNLGKQKLNKDGTPRKCNLTEEQKLKRAEILRKGREKAHERRRQLEKQAKDKPHENKYVEKKVEQDIESEPETIKVMSKPKKTKQKKKVYVYEDTSSSEEEIVVRKKKSKKRTPTPSPPPAPPAPAPAQPVVKPSPQPSAEEIEKIRKEKIRRYKEIEKKEKFLASIFG